MPEFVSFNGQIVSTHDVNISALSAAAIFGTGIFTTVAIYHGTPFLWKKHWLRLENNAETLMIDLSEFSEVATQVALKELIQKNKVSSGRARITFFDESTTKIWPFETDKKTSLLITTGDPRPVPGNFRLTVSPYPVNSHSPLAGIKSCNYLGKILTLDEAKSRGFDEAIQVNERGEITSASMANVFWLKDEMLLTPGLNTGCLAGTTREFVMESIECREVEATLEELLEADAIFLTSAGLGVAAVKECDGRKLPVGEFLITKLLS